jgi:hypothetical protein
VEGLDVHRKKHASDGERMPGLIQPDAQNFAAHHAHRDPHVMHRAERLGK